MDGASHVNLEKVIKNIDNGSTSWSESACKTINICPWHLYKNEYFMITNISVILSIAVIFVWFQINVLSHVCQGISRSNESDGKYITYKGYCEHNAE